MRITSYQGALPFTPALRRDHPTGKGRLCALVVAGVVRTLTVARPVGGIGSGTTPGLAVLRTFTTTGLVGVFGVHGVHGVHGVFGMHGLLGRNLRTGRLGNR